MGAAVAEQIKALRVELLNMEHEKELMRSKLLEEQMQREKAEKQVSVRHGALGFDFWH